MKIVFLHLTMGINNRGSEAVVELLAGELSKEHQVTVIQGGRGASEQFQIIRPLRITKVPKSAPQNLFEKIQFRLTLDPLSRLISLFTRSSIDPIRTIDPDIIIPINGASQLEMLKVAFPNKKFVCFGHAGIGYHDAGVLKKSPDLFIALTPTAKKWASNLAEDETKVAFVPNPIDLSKYSHYQSTAFDLRQPVVLSVGALSRYKNHDLVIMAVAKTTASLLIVGKGEEESGLRSLAGKLLRGRYRFMSAEPEQMPDIYHSVDAFCLMSDLQESFGLVYLEAMAANLPIVAPRDNIRRNIIGRNGYYSAYEISDIADNIQKAIGKKPLNYKNELEKYDHHLIGQKISALLTAQISDGSK